MAARTNKVQHSERDKDSIKASQLVNRLQDIALNKVQASTEQIAAAKAVLPFLRPTLSSVEVTELDPRDKMTESDIIQLLTGVISSSPGVLDTLLSLVSSINPQALLTHADRIRSIPVSSDNQTGISLQ